MSRLIVVSWAFAVLVGLGSMAYYNSLPGESAVTHERWPASTSLSSPQAKPVLLVFLHPDCPCSVASLRELELLLPHLRSRVETRIVFMAGLAAKEGRLWEMARRLPDVGLFLDPKGTDTKLFGAMTSGHSVLYDDTSRLVYRGGLTPARGHMGESAGKTFLLDWLAGSNKEKNLFTEIFGCSIFRKPT